MTIPLLASALTGVHGLWQDVAPVLLWLVRRLWHTDRLERSLGPGAHFFRRVGVQALLRNPGVSQRSKFVDGGSAEEPQAASPEGAGVPCDDGKVDAGGVSRRWTRGEAFAVFIFLFYHLDAMHANNALFRDPRFLALALVLGVVCMDIFLRTDSLWPPALVHGVYVWVWVGFLACGRI